MSLIRICIYIISMIRHLQGSSSCGQAGLFQVVQIQLYKYGTYHTPTTSESWDLLLI